MRIPFVFLVSFIMVLSVISISFIPPDIKKADAASQWVDDDIVVVELDDLQGCSNVRVEGTTAESDYTTIAGSCLLCTSNGTLLAWTSARYDGTSDYSPSDSFLIKSFDGGLTWTDPLLFCDSISDSEVYGGYGVSGGADDHTFGRVSGEVVGDTVWIAIQGNINSNNVVCFLLYSDDNGSTWSQYFNLTNETDIWDISSYDNYTFIGAGNNDWTYTSIGRLVVPGWTRDNTGSSYRAFTAWTDNINLGFNATWGNTSYFGSSELSEWGCVECENGSIFGTFKGQTSDNARMERYSSNGSVWGDPYNGGIPDPRSKASIIEFTDTLGYNTSRWVFCWNNNTNSREDLSIAIGYNNCSSWPYYREISSSQYAQYPSVTITDNMSIAAIYTDTLGTSATFLNCTLCNLEWVSNGADSLDPIGGDPGGEYNPSVINEMGYSGNYSLGNESVMVGDFYINWTWDTNGTPSYHWINISNSSGFSTLYKNFNVSHAGVVEGSYCNYTITIVTASTTKRYIHIRSFYE